jgi:hypothetical protein
MSKIDYKSAMEMIEGACEAFDHEGIVVRLGLLADDAPNLSICPIPDWVAREFPELAARAIGALLHAPDDLFILA